MSFLFSSISAGLDVQPDGMRFLQLRKRKGNFEVDVATFYPLSPALFTGDQITDWPAFCVSLKHFVQTMGIKRGLPLTIQLPVTLVKTKRLLLPLGFSKNEILLEIQEHLDLRKDKNNFCIDFMRMPRQQQSHLDLFCVAAERDYITQYVRCINEAGFCVKMVTIDVYALHSFLNLAHENEINTILYLKNKTILLVVFHGLEVIFHYHWQEIEFADVLLQLKKVMQICSKTYGYLKAQKMIVLNAQVTPNVMAEVKSWWCGCVHDHQWLQKIPGMQSLSCEQQIEFLMAFGLATSH